jgi:hypothetical protein
MTGVVDDVDVLPIETVLVVRRLEILIRNRVLTGTRRLEIRSLWVGIVIDRDRVV